MKSDSLRRPPVEATKRKGMHRARRDRIFNAKGGACYICGSPLDRYDIEHPVALGLGGSDDDGDLYPVCPPGTASNCHGIKTALDKKAIAKAKRTGKKDRGEQPKSKHPLKSAGFKKGGPKQKFQSRPFPKR